MPKMTNRWHNAAVVMAALGFAAIAVKLVTGQDVPIEPCRRAPSGISICFENVSVDLLPTLFVALLNAAIWFGVVYLVFLVVYGLKRSRR